MDCSHRSAGRLSPCLQTLLKASNAGGKGDKVRFLNISQGSLEETRYFLILSQDLGYGNSSEPLQQVEETSRLLNSYSHTIEAN